jgi:hypothetical protein
MTVAKLRQAGGFRIDFFGGSELNNFQPVRCRADQITDEGFLAPIGFLFAASIFLTCFLGGSGWAIYRGSLLALAKWRGL